MEMGYATWDEVRDFCKTCDQVFIPTGVLEAKGYHQPMATDAILAEELAKHLSERLKALVFPTITIGVSAAGAKTFFGSVQVSNDVFCDYLKQICDWLVYWGLKRFVFFNGHGPNAKAIREVAWYLKNKYSVRCVSIQFNPFFRTFAEDLCDSENPFAHAGEAETSVMLHWRPEVVKINKAQVRQFKAASQMIGLEKFEDLEFDFGFMTETGHLGDPTLATAEKGRIIAKRMLDYLEKYIKEEMR